MGSIRLLTIGLPNLLNDLVSNAFNKAGMLSAIECYEDVQQFIANRTDVDDSVIIVESMSVDDCMKILHSHQRICLVCVEDSGKKFHLWELIPQRQVLGELSLDELVNRIFEN